MGENLRALRSQLMLRWFNADPANKVIAWWSPGPAKAAASSREPGHRVCPAGERTLLIDGTCATPPA